MKYSWFGLSTHRSCRGIAERLTFYPRTGSNITLSIGGRTAERINTEHDSSFGGLVTLRPLKEEERFTVQVRKTLDWWGGHSLGIGITTVPADHVDFPPWMALSKPNNWMMYFCEGWPGKFCLYRNGMELSKQFGMTAHQLKVGDRFGVVRKRNGDLLFYANEYLLGKALLSIPETVYGMVEVRGNARQITIVDSL